MPLAYLRREEKRIRRSKRQERGTRRGGGGQSVSVCVRARPWYRAASDVIGHYGRHGGPCVHRGFGAPTGEVPAHHMRAISELVELLREQSEV